MKINRYPKDFDIAASFPEARKVHAGEGECVYSAEREGRFYVIIDSRTMLDLLSEEDASDLHDAIIAGNAALKLLAVQCVDALSENSSAFVHSLLRMNPATCRHPIQMRDTSFFLNNLTNINLQNKNWSLNGH